MSKSKNLSLLTRIPAPAVLSLAVSVLLLLTGCGAVPDSSPQSPPSATTSSTDLAPTTSSSTSTPSAATSENKSKAPLSGTSTETAKSPTSITEEQTPPKSKPSYNNPSDHTPSESAERPGSADTFPAGTYLVGTDLPPGTYLIEQDTGMFPGKILLTSDDSGSLSSVLDDIGFYNRVYLTVREGEYIQIEGTARPADTVPPYKKTNDTEAYPSGMYLVGKDLAPGLYEIRSSRSGAAGSYSISTDARGNMSNFYQRTTISEPVIQVLEEGQYITLNGAVMRP